jgi:hypothetical protein
MVNNNTLSDILSSVPNTSEFNVPTELQRTDDFRSTAPESREEEELANTYYSHVDWTRLPLLEGVRNGKGASKSYVWNYGWRMQKKGIIPLKYHWVCTSCHQTCYWMDWKIHWIMPRISYGFYRKSSNLDR